MLVNDFLIDFDPAAFPKFWKRAMERYPFTKDVFAELVGFSKKEDHRLLIALYGKDIIDRAVTRFKEMYNVDNMRHALDEKLPGYRVILAPMKECPRCGFPTTPETLDGETIYKCNADGIAFMSRDQFKKIVWGWQ